MALKLNKIGKKIGPLTREYDWKDVVMYALGVGAGYDELEYCYEDGLKVIPSFAAAMAYPFLAESGIAAGVNPAGLLHAEQDIIFHSPIPTKGKLTSKGKIVEVYDKGKEKGALLVAEADTFYDSGQKLFTNVFTLFCRLDGGFGGPDVSKDEVVIPDRAPDMEDEFLPADNQPLFYRLSGDLFPLHADPKFAQKSGFERPIMHGLCTQGYACRILIKHLFPGEPERIKRLRVKFSRPLYPNVPVTVRIWKTGGNKGLFQVVNPQTDEKVIDRGVIEWKSPEEADHSARQTGIRFDDRVAVVTGAGGGLGKAYALEFAKRGAKVVVNDLGDSVNGKGEVSGRPADRVVEEIKALGGEAVASYDSVATTEGGQAVVDKAIKTFGRVDILVNNAGILRDKTFAKMTPDDWQDVISVHLTGAYNVTRPAYLKMCENGYGRIVMTASAAGLFGNFGQANYSAAKAGLIGLMNTMELEGEKHDIKINTIAPVAATRMTDGLMPEDLVSRVKPECVAPMVLYLGSEICAQTGMIFNAGMGFFGRTAAVSGPGVGIGEAGSIPTVEDVHENWKKINSLKGAKEFHDTNMSTGPMLDAFAPKSAGGDDDENLTIQAVFDMLPEVFQKDEAGGADVVFQFAISGPEGGDWFVTVKDDACEIEKGRHPEPTVVFKLSDEDFPPLMTGKLNGMQAFTAGKLKIEGDMMKSQLMEKVFKF